jgi:hypothetical protein
MVTKNSWNNQVLAADVTFNGGTMSIGTDATSGAINIGTGAAARVLTLGNISGASAVNINTGTAGSAITTTNGTFAVVTGTGAVNLGTDATAKTITLGNVTGASAVNINTGTGGSTITLTNGTFNVYTGTGAVYLGTDAVQKSIYIGNATGNTAVYIEAGTGPINVGANAIARTITVGCTTGASALNMYYGTSDFVLGSASGSVITASDGGTVQKPLQPGFCATSSATISDVTGDGTCYTIVFNTESYDIGANYNNGTGIFTAPVTGKYLFTNTNYTWGVLAGAYGLGGIRSTFGYAIYDGKYYEINENYYNRFSCSQLCQLTAGDTAYAFIRILGMTKTVDIEVGGFFSGQLIS